MLQIGAMQARARVGGGGDSLAAGRGRQRLKFAAIGYASARHGVDADDDLVTAADALLRKMAVEFAEALSGPRKNRRPDLHLQGDSEMLRLCAIAYASSRHGIDADVGMAREGMAMLCQAAIDFDESLPRDESPKRSGNAHLQLGNGARS